MSGLEWIQPVPYRRRFQAHQEQRDERIEAAALETAAESAAEALTALQTAEGYWCAELTADATLEADYVLLQLWLHRPEGKDWQPPTRKRIDGAVRTLLARQLPDGGWNIYPGGPAEVNATVRSYASLKIAGCDPESAPMVRARERAVALGGLHACNSYARLNLSLFGLYPRAQVPCVPPEMVLLPGNALYEMSSWTRTIVVPLSIVQSCGETRNAPEGVTLDELLVPVKGRMRPRKDCLEQGFHHLDRALKLWEKRGPKPIRAAAVREAERWMLERTRYTEGLGAIYPAMMYSIMAMNALGYAEDHPDFLEAVRQFDDLLLESEDRFQFQPCVSPLWDTAYAAFILGEQGETSAEGMTHAADWMLDREIRRKGDWSVKRPDLEPSGWAFEFANEYYPDIDDTAQVLLALKHARASDPARQARCEARAIKWLLGMQSSDGGWAAFDVDNNWQVLNKVPFADHNAMLDPTCADITGRVLEALSRHGLPAEHPAIQGGIRYLLATQEKDGSWYGRWGVNYVYGTFLALRGLAATGDPAARPAMQEAARWLRSVQNPDGGWGESCSSYDEDRFVPEQSTASQTAWGLLGLAAAGDTGSRSVERGVDYLLSTQKPDGTWDEELATGTGFPRVFYLTYHLYRLYFPLLALATLRPAWANRDRNAVVALNGIA